MQPVNGTVFKIKSDAWTEKTFIMNDEVARGEPN